MITLGMAQSFAPNELEQEQDSNDNVWFACFFVNGRVALHLGMNGFLLFLLYQHIERDEIEYYWC